MGVLTLLSLADKNKASYCPIVENILEEFKKFLSEPRNLLILSHKNPDGDAVGSALGFKHILTAMGHTVTAAVPDAAPGFLKWLPGHKDLIIFERKNGKKAAAEAFRTADMIICVDFNSPDRLGDLECLFRAGTSPTLLIDHHPPQEQFTDMTRIDPTRGSTAELIYLMAVSLEMEAMISPDAATCLLAGIMTDTVGFKVSCSYPEIFETVASLMRLGGNKDRIYEEVYGQFSSDRMRLLGYSLVQKMKIIPGTGAAYIDLTRAELKQFNHKKGDTEGFVNYPLSIGEVIFSVLFTEQEDHIKLSLRSTGNFPANEFASRYFNGGGHLNAAGGRFFGNMEQALKHFEGAVEIYQGLLTNSKS